MTDGTDTPKPAPQTVCTSTADGREGPGRCLQKVQGCSVLVCRHLVWQPCFLVHCCCLPGARSAWLCSPVTPARSICRCDKPYKGTKAFAEYTCSVAPPAGIVAGLVCHIGPAGPGPVEVSIADMETEPLGQPQAQLDVKALQQQRSGSVAVCVLPAVPRWKRLNCLQSLKYAARWQWCHDSPACGTSGP